MQEYEARSALTPGDLQSENSANPKRERPRDRLGRPLAWDASPELELLDYDSLPEAENHELALGYFNQQAFFPAHEAWEAAWRQARGTADEDFFNGLAKLGAGCTHIQRGNARGAHTLIGKALQRIEPYGPYHRGIDVISLCDALKDLLTLIEPFAHTREAPVQVGIPQIQRSP